MEYYSVIKKNEIMPSAATWVGLRMSIQSGVRQTEKDKYHVSHIRRISKYDKRSFFTKQKHTEMENKIMVPKGKVG